MPVKQQKKTVRKQQVKKPQQQKKTVGFFKRCADIVVVINLLLPVLLSIFLIITLLYAVAKKKDSTLIYPMLYGLLALFVLIGITLLLYKYFPDALCVLFLVNLVFSFFTLASVPFGQEEEEAKKK